MDAQALRRIEKLQQEVEHLRGENAKLQAQLFGRKSEKQSSRDRSNHLEGEAESSSKRSRGQQPGNPGPKRRDYFHLPAVDEPLEVPEAQPARPKCGQAVSPTEAE